MESHYNGLTLKEKLSKIYSMPSFSFKIWRSLCKGLSESTLKITKQKPVQTKLEKPFLTKLHLNRSKSGQQSTRVSCKQKVWSAHGPRKKKSLWALAPWERREFEINSHFKELQLDTCNFSSNSKTVWWYAFLKLYF